MESNLERTLIDNVLAGDQNAYRHLVVTHHVHVYNLVLRIVQQRELAEELAQDVFLKAYRSLKSFKRTAKFSTWLYRIAYNEAVSYTRKRKLEFVDITEIQSTGHEESEDVSLGWEAEEDPIELLEDAIRSLNKDAQLLLGMYYQQEMSVTAISKVTGVSESSIKVRLFRTRKELKGILEIKGMSNIINATSNGSK